MKFNNIILNKKKFHRSKEPIDLLSVDLDQIVVSYKFKDNGEGFKHFIGYQKGETVKPLCIILPQMSGYIKYFENFDLWILIKKIIRKVYLEECRYRIKKRQMPKFIKDKLKLDLDSDLDSGLDLDSDVESKSDAKLMTNLILILIMILKKIK